MAKIEEISINANPTKSFFISLITRDVNIVDCIKDLIDNSIDGAVRNGAKKDFSNFKISLQISPASFEISDNCGGIALKAAQEYAFRFGRPDDVMPTNKLYTGRYGIGMKRSIFKIGKMVRIDTVALKDRFALTIDVEKWRADDAVPWEFKIEDWSKQAATLKNTHARISISKLNPEVASEFGDNQFISRLMDSITFAYSDRLRNGLHISLNGNPAHQRKMELLSSTEVKPISRSEMFDGVNTRIYSGLANASDDERSTSDDAGWYVFCNNRLILAGDKSIVTGWGRENDNPGFHPQYNQVRGYIFFESENPDLLPWNTAKNQLNTESSVYRAARPAMAQSLREVIDYLNERKEARSKKDVRFDVPMKKAQPKPLWDLKKSAHFSVRTKKSSRKDNSQKIQYDVPLWKAEKAKKELKAKSWTRLGELTFEYFYSRECKA